ncbi:triose-phosphate isomerase [Flavobacteriales bacterium]|nr:triose-phosphate isomerase [Flavobacteriales bacterium]
MVYVVANWKMNKTKNESISFLKGINSLTEGVVDSSLCRILISPPIIHLPAIEQAIGKTGLVAQNIACKEKGAYTGETSVTMLPEKVSHVIVGHSERRHYFHESSPLLLEKLKLCINHNMTPIFCFGEHLKQRDSGSYLSYIEKQLSETIFCFKNNDISKMILAYEPVWAIGTGKNADSLQINEVHDFVRKLLVDQIKNDIADEIPILYGGSCNSSNAKSIIDVHNVNGLLVGGASLDLNHFHDIIKIAHGLS